MQQSYFSSRCKRSSGNIYIYIYCTCGAKFWELFSVSLIGALAVGSWTCTPWPLALPLPLTLPHFLSFCLSFHFPWYKKKDPKDWDACPIQSKWVFQWCPLAWSPIMPSPICRRPAQYDFSRYVISFFFSFDFCWLTAGQTKVYIYITINLEVSIDSIKFITWTRIGGQVCTLLYVLDGKWPHFDLPYSSTDIINFQVYTCNQWSSYTSRPRNSLVIGTAISRHSTRTITTNANVAFCFVVLANRYVWYGIRLDSHFTNSLCCCA